ncbi:hypothetical protein [Streptomyces sp. LN590]|uniref:hypothetical protein n=1 Tax=Streptomyces sp. LN590 TaxID=3112980 RepID=UPI00371DFC80
MTTPDALINGGLVFGPGLLLAIGTVTTCRACRWAVDRTHQLIDNRATRRQYAAIAARWHQVENNANAFIAQAGDQLADRVLQQIHADDTREGEK